MIAVVITHYNREAQLLKTIKTIQETACTDYRIIVVDDASDHLPDVAHIRIEPEDKKWNDVVVPFNIGILAALRLTDSDIIIIQNAECYHFGDVLTYANDHVSDGTCVSFACWNLDNEYTDTDYNLLEIIKERQKDLTYGTGWYNHPINARYLNFCNAYSRADMIALNGLDERFSDGVGCADNDLARRMLQMKLKILITDESKPFVVHQYHSRSWQEDLYESGGAVDNEALFYHMRTNEAKNYRAQHILTENFDEYINHP